MTDVIYCLFMAGKGALNWSPVKTKKGEKGIPDVKVCLQEV